jgi:hypothetical protein
MSVSYDRKKIDEFNKLLIEFNEKKNEFNNEYNEFVSTIETVITNYLNEAENVYKIYKGATTNTFYILTPSKILMKINNPPETITATSEIDDTGFEIDTIVSVDGDNVFYSKIIYKGPLGGDDLVNNKYIQVGLGDVDLEGNPGTFDDTYEIQNNEKSPVFKQSGNCDGPFYEKCDGYSKFTNNPYYGIGLNDENCTCYTFSDEEKNKLDKMYTQIINIDITDKLFGDNTTMPISYFGVMMDGGLYVLKNSNFSDNYNESYKPNTDNHKLLSMDGFTGFNYLINGCNMYTGSGPFDIQINSLGENVCVKK